MSYASMGRAGGGRRAVRAYAAIDLETKVMGASPERLITLLFDGALAAIAQAKLHLQQGDVAARGAAISKAIDIVDSGLKASVDREAGGEVATHLVAAYELISYYLLQANMNADSTKLDMAAQVLGTLGEAWRTANDPQPQVAAG